MKKIVIIGIEMNTISSILENHDKWIIMSSNDTTRELLDVTFGGV